MQWIYFEELSKKYNAPLITYWIGRSVIVDVSIEQNMSNIHLEIQQSGSMMLGQPVSFSTKERASTVPDLECWSLQS